MKEREKLTWKHFYHVTKPESFVARVVLHPAKRHELRLTSHRLFGVRGGFTLSKKWGNFRLYSLWLCYLFSIYQITGQQPIPRAVGLPWSCRARSCPLLCTSWPCPGKTNPNPDLMRTRRFLCHCCQRLKICTIEGKTSWKRPVLVSTCGCLVCVLRVDKWQRQ